MTVKDKVIVITGASSGIGAASARLLAQNGAKVVLGARREARLQELVRTIEQAGGTATYAVTDVTDRAQVQALVQKALDTYGQLDVIFNNAGIMPTAPLSELQVDEWQRTVDINLNGVLYGLAAVLPIFTKQKHGQVITTSSVAGIKSFAGAGVYGATKFAVRNLMEVLRMESAQEGTNIRTTTLYPAAINTELLNSITDDQAKQDMTAFYDQVGITPDAVARVVNFAVDQPADVNVNEFTIYPTKQA